MNVAAGGVADSVDRIGDREHVIGEGALESSLLLLRRAEVDHPRIDAVLAQNRHRARGGRDVVDLGRQHHRRHQQHRRAGGLAARVVVTQPVNAVLALDHVGRRLLIGGQAAEAGHLEGVLGRGANTHGGSRDRLRKQVH
jgi:hypothetical protein